LAALYVEESEQGKGLGEMLLKHGAGEAARLGFPTVYLFTDHVGYYEKYDWKYIADGYGIDGEASRIYEFKEIHGNAYRHPDKYHLLTSHEKSEPFLRNPESNSQ
jgi:GNAT superfamily N-acetyltransferase